MEAPTRSRPIGQPRAGRINSGLLVALVVLLAAAAAFWGYRWWSTPRLKPVAAGAERTLALACGECKYAESKPASQVQAMESNADGYLKCPKCGKFAVSGARRGSSVLMPVIEGDAKAP